MINLKKEIIDTVKKSFALKVQKGKTFIYCYAFDKTNKNKNNFFSINCQTLTSLQPSIYDNLTNSVSVYCCECIFLGKIEFVIKGKIKDSSLKEFLIPIPNKIVYKNLNKKFYNTYNCMKKKYSDRKKYTIKLFQLVEI
jgi:hypothetical protein